MSTQPQINGPVDITTVQRGQQFKTTSNRRLQPFSSADDFRLAYSMAQQLAASELVPKRYHNKPMDCLLAIDMAGRTGSNPLMVLQNLYNVHGTPGWSGQYIIAAINQSGRFAEPLHFEFVGEKGKDTWGCYAMTLTHSGREIKGPTITIGLAKAEGWYGKSGSKWQTIPELMLRYRAGAWFGKTECPEILMGFPADDEIRDGAVYDVDPKTGEIIEPRSPFSAPSGGRAQQREPAAAESQEEKSAADPAAAVGAGSQEFERQIEKQGFYQDGERFFNVHGEMWNPEIHATSADGDPVVNKDGSFRARRGAAKDEAEKDNGAQGADEAKAPEHGEEEATAPSKPNTGGFSLD